MRRSASLVASRDPLDSLRTLVLSSASVNGQICRLSRQISGSRCLFSPFVLVSFLVQPGRFRKLCDFADVLEGCQRNTEQKSATSARGIIIIIFFLNLDRFLSLQ